MPVDVNHDKLGHANDVRFLIDVLSGATNPAPPMYQTDTAVEYRRVDWR